MQMTELNVMLVPSMWESHIARPPTFPGRRSSQRPRAWNGLSSFTPSQTTKDPLQGTTDQRGESRNNYHTLTLPYRTVFYFSLTDRKITFSMFTPV